MLADTRDNRGAYEVVAVVAREEEVRVVRRALPTATLASLLEMQNFGGMRPRTLGSELVRSGN